MSDEKKSCERCDSETCSAKDRKPDESLEAYQERQALERRMCQIKHKIMVLSGKGGVGKSTVAANLAMALALSGRRVGLLDIDIHGPSIPKLLNIEGRTVQGTDDNIMPVTISDNLKVMSIGFMLRSPDDAIIWRGPLKMGVIKQFLKDVEWGTLDYLVVDSPPGTGDEPLSICQLIPDATGAIIVTTPQELSVVDVRKCINFCRKLETQVLGVIENMSGFVCPKCGEVTEIFKTGGGRTMAESMGVPFLGSIPIDPEIVEASDSGRPYVYHYSHSETCKAFLRAARPIVDLDLITQAQKEEKKKMRIAIPLAGGKLSMHFGHCEEFALINVNTDSRGIESTEIVEAPEHQPGLLPRWLAEHGTDVIIAGGMGRRAQDLFAQQGIGVIVGAPAEAPETLIAAYLNGMLKTGENICDH